MGLLVAGIVLWAFVHLFKRLASGARDRAIERMGLGSVKLLVTVFSFVALGMIVIGFKITPFVPIYEPPSWGTYVNSPLMFCVVVLFGMGSSRGSLRPVLRHPMLLGVIVWSVAHLLVNGDNASLILFPAMMVWAVLEIIVINTAEGPWQRPEPGPFVHDLRLIGIAAVIFAAIAFIHGLVGPSPFPG